MCGSVWGEQVSGGTESKTDRWNRIKNIKHPQFAVSIEKEEHKFERRREGKESEKKKENASEIYDQIKFLTKIIALLYIHTSLEFSFFHNSSGTFPPKKILLVAPFFAGYTFFAAIRFFSGEKFIRRRRK